MKIIDVINANLSLIVNGVRREDGLRIGVLLFVNQKAYAGQKIECRCSHFSCM